MAEFAPLVAAIQLLVTVVAQPFALAVVAWGLWFAAPAATRAYGLGVLRAGAVGWVLVAVAWTSWGVLADLGGGYNWQGRFIPEYLALTGLLANLGFAVGGTIIASWDYAERYEPPSVRV
jgi:hypothetical protein